MEWEEDDNGADAPDSEGSESDADWAAEEASEAGMEIDLELENDPIQEVVGEGVIGIEQIEDEQGVTEDEEEVMGNEDEEEENGQHPVELHQPFMDSFIPLTDMPEATMDGVKALAMDVDRWELVISPEEYLNRFKDVLADVQLINRAPLRGLHTTFHRGPGFDNYLLLAKSTHELWVAVKFKTPFFQALNQYQTAQPGPLAQQASLGSVHVSTSVFIHCLIKARCHTIRLKSYGQKLPIVHRFLNTEPAQRDHTWAEHNEWDIGTSFRSDHVWLFASATGRHHGLEHYPMLVPGSGGFGSVNAKVKYGARHFSVKVYPLLVHVIKSFNSHLQSSVPKTLSGVRHQVEAAVRMIHSLTSKDPASLGGFRIEVTVKAPTLKDACRVVQATDLLKPSYWLGLGDGNHTKNILAAKLVDKQALLDNANWVHQQAVAARVFTGHATTKPTKHQLQILTDILNALGWNNGRRRPTRSGEVTAWWNETDSPPTLFGKLCERYHTDEEIKTLFQLARENSIGGHGLPCKSQPNNPAHRYQVNNGSPFRIRCCVPGCFHKLARAAIIQWISDLVRLEVIDGSVLPVDPDLLPS